MTNSILTVCTGNICRSPVAEAALRMHLPELDIASAGLAALVGRDIDADSATAARDQGIALLPHSARQFNADIGRVADIILVMETHHRQEIAARWPQFLGKTFLLGHFDGAQEVPDPYRQAMGMHEHAVEIIARCSAAWAKQLELMRS
ncbi:low molecular weight protein-tyrosine-phosphatase [Salibaculum sp.]|uniref:low molecular weight protein-tyrosine-phosphatase n=1 Tax=Salibaculum sp. TaxID=2855480 RepID=UPI002B484D21|nr:low molecular weight protein-tyrosine-phosphatase [Salibaculum sp.]HKL69605.1 low molecular weight protein-tyrosine-phosphatase [Salibaculum sp.]